MMVFSKEKLVFLAVPKTGSTAYQAALADQASLVVRDPPELKHAPLFRYNRFFRPALERFIEPNLAILAVMREPADWLGSWYRYRSRADLRDTGLSTAGMSFEAFIDAYLSQPRPRYAQVGSQAKFLEPMENGTAVTHLFRYDDQAGLQAFLEARLGREVHTQNHNVSPPGETLLSPDLRKRLQDQCAADFTLYDSILPKGSYTPIPRGTAQPHR